MAFHFTLAAVLRYQQSLEEREELRLHGQLAQRATLLQELEQASAARRGLQTATQRAFQQAALPAAEIQFAVAQINALERQLAVLQSRRLNLESEIAQQTARYRQQRQKREVLESLRELQWREYRVRQQRREQAMLDELHLLRRGRGQA
ncbi:MAG: flagellar FliJ family protein [Candidatus Korobacteraceae bacterium]